MKISTKRFIAILLSLLMILPMFTAISVSAEDTATVTGLALIVDGVEYTSGVVRVNATSNIVLKAYGVNLNNVSWQKHKIEYKYGNAVSMGPLYSWTTSDDGTTSTKTIAASSFSNVSTPFTLKFTNDGNLYVDSTVSIVYSNDANAEIDSISLTVDGKEYTSGNVIIYSDSKVSVNVKGVNLQNIPQYGVVKYASNSYIYIREMSLYDNCTLASCELSGSEFVSSSDFELQYMKDAMNEREWRRTDIYIVYDDSTSPSNGAEIFGTYVNLGGDIEMNYVVRIASSIDADDVTLKTVLFGKERILTCSRVENTSYVFTLNGILPQLLGEDIDAELYVGNTKVDELLDYSVEDNLLAIDEADLTDNKKQLIVDLLAYGMATENYVGYNSLIGSYGVREVEIPLHEASVSDENSAVSLMSASVSLGVSTRLMFKLKTNGSSASGQAYINNKLATTYVEGDTLIVISAPISPENFYKDVKLSYEDGNGRITLEYSVNDYCYETVKEGSLATEEMKALATALYNYGISAHLYNGVHFGGTSSCSEKAKCIVCGEGYGDMLEHSYVYTADDENDTIRVSCKGCELEGHVSLILPENAVYNGSAWEATTECDFEFVTPTVTYDRTPINAGAYTVTLSVADCTVSAELIIDKAYPEYPSGITASYDQILGNIVLPSGWSWVDKTLKVGDVGINTHKAQYIPADAENYYALDNIDLSVEVLKSIITVDDVVSPEPATGLVYNGGAQSLVSVPGTVVGGTIVYSLTEDGEYSADIPVATNAGEYTVYWTVESDKNHYEVEAIMSFTVTIERKTITEDDVSLGEYDPLYDGSEKRPAVIIVVDGRTLIDGVDFNARYYYNVHVGVATVGIYFNDNYAGSVFKNFDIVQKPGTGEFEGDWVLEN